MTVAGEEWEQHETRGCWHRADPARNPQCHSTQLLIKHAESMAWLRAMLLVREEADEIRRRGGMVSSYWVSERLRNLADFGVADPDGEES